MSDVSANPRLIEYRLPTGELVCLVDIPATGTETLTSILDAHFSPAPGTTLSATCSAAPRREDSRAAREISPGASPARGPPRLQPLAPT